MLMAQTASFQPELSESEFDELCTHVMAQARRMTRSQILDLADNLHELIRNRQAVERSFARRHAHGLA
ncbi:MAG: hypothetical protein BGN86_05100 [Caulobacterales bacterium 68-7]|nr:MAG: hypothetical protein BGN86_05100 [Caulobacterales bacterium 68-7]